MLIPVLTAPVPGHTRDHARDAEPVTFGVPLPRGLVRDPSNWVIRSSSASDGGTEWQGLQTRVLDRWADGSARWVLVDSQIKLPPGGRDSLEIDTDHSPVGFDRTIKTVTSAGAITVDTGAASFEVRPGPSFPFTSIRAAAGYTGPAQGMEILHAAACRLVAVDSQGKRHEAYIDRVELEAPGPIRCVVRMDGRLNLESGRSLTVTVRAHFFAGLSTVRLSLTVLNPEPAKHKGGFWDLGDPNSVLVKDLGLSLALSGSVGERAIAFSPETGMPLEPASVPFELYQDSSGGESWQSANHINRERKIPVTFRGYRICFDEHERRGLRATPVVSVQSTDGALCVAIPEFWQNFPKAIEVSTTALTLRLFPGQFADFHEIQGGEQKTHECWLGFGADLEPLDWCRSPTFACVAPAWTLSSAAIPFLAPLAPEHAALVESAIEGPDRFELKREIIDEFGWRHFGELYGDHEAVRQKDPPLVSHYNNQYDPVSGFILQYLRTADPRWWTMADELARHVVDIDIYHSDRDKYAYNGGMFWHTYHYGDADTSTHRTYPVSARGITHGGGPSAGHNYTTGLMLYHFLTGDVPARQSVIGLGRYVLELDDGSNTIFRWLDRANTGFSIQSATGYYGPGRAPANSLNALVDAYRLSGDERLADKADELVRTVIHPRQDISSLRLDVPEQRWFYTMFLQALGKYLHDRVERGLLDGMYSYGRASLLHFADWMASHEHPYFEKPERLEFRTETWPAQDIRKSDAFFFAWLHADPAVRDAYLERGTFFHRYSLETLASMPTRVFARPVVVLLTSGFLQGWVSANSGAKEPDGPRLDRIGEPVEFLSQRSNAVRKVKRLVAAGVAAALLLLALAVLR